MCRACGKRHNSVVEIDSSTSPRGPQDAGSLESINSAPFSQGSWPISGGAGPMDLVPASRGSGLTMKEYDQHLARLNKENFALKLRIYFMEEQQGHVSQNAPQLYSNNLELKVENESLKRQLYDKQQLLGQASEAMNQMDEDFKDQLNNLMADHEEKTKEMEDSSAQMQKSLEMYAARCAELESALEKPELTQLCDLAFPSEFSKGMGSEGDGHAIGKGTTATEGERRESTSSGKEDGEVMRKMSGDSVHINTTNITNNNINNSLPNTSNNLQQMQYQQCPPSGTQVPPEYFQYQQYSHETGTNVPTTQTSNGTPTVVVVPVPTGEHQHAVVPGTAMVPAGADSNTADIIRMLQAEISSLQEKLQMLQNELGGKEQLMHSLQAHNDALVKELQEKEKDVVEREEKVEALSQELETRHQQIQCKDDTICSLHSDLNRVEPEISVKVQEIVERDRIIEEKIEQIEQQNKILVEIQITLDEKQKQIAELEASLTEAKGKVDQLGKDYDKSCQAIKVLADEKNSRDKEISSLKKEVKKRDRKIKDLVAELKETLDSLAKAKWEAQAGAGGEDSVKEMLEEENERLWADVEQKKIEMQNMRAELDKSFENKECTSDELQKCQALLSERQEAIESLSAQAKAMSEKVERMEALKAELCDIKQRLDLKEGELNDLRSSKGCSSEEYKRLKSMLEECQVEKTNEIEMLKGEIEAKNGDILKLKNKLMKESKDAVEAPQMGQSTISEVCDKAISPLHLSINTALPVENAGPSALQQPKAVAEVNHSDVDKPSIANFQQQIEKLREELQSTNKAIDCQVQELGGNRKNYRDVTKYRNEILRLKKKLAESNSTCEMMRNRLEELADFLEQLLELEDNGLIDMSKLSGFNRNQLYKTLNDSRQLSQSFSMTALLDLELEMGEEELEADNDHQHSVLPESSAFFTDDPTNASCFRDSLLEVSKLGDGLSSENQQLIAKLCNDLQAKACQMDDILSKVAEMSQSLEAREDRIQDQSQVIERLEAQLQDVSLSTEALQKELSSVECQTLLAMAPRQSNIESLAELSTPYLSSCPDSLPQIRETVATEDLEKKLPSFPDAQSTASKMKSTGGYASASEVHPAPPRVPASPSESEAWSEPDRNVSLARIGLETCTLAASVDRSLSRSRQARASAALSSESDTEECPVPLPEENISSLLMPAPCTTLSVQPLSAGSSAKPSPKRRSDASEIRRLTTKLRALEHLNDTLKAELNIYQSLSHQLSPTTDQQQSDSRSSLHSFSELPDHLPLSIEAASSSSSKVNSIPLTLKKMRRFGGTEDNLALAAPLLQEIRSLRTKLEESINNNDQLRDQLEAAVLSCTKASDDPSHLTHLTAALLNAQETLQLTREKLAFAQRCEQVQADRCSLAEKRAEDDVKMVETLRIQLKDYQNKQSVAEQNLEALQKRSEELETKYNTAEAQLVEANKLHEDNEACLHERLSEVRRACEESEGRLKAQHDAINEMFRSLQESPSQSNHVSHLHSALQASETQVLRVTRDRMTLLGEKTKLQAQLMSAQAQTCLLQDSLCEESSTTPDDDLQHQSEVKSNDGVSATLSNQLARVQAAVKNLQTQCSRLEADNASLVRQRDQLHEKLSGYKAVEKLSNKPDITLESVVTDKGDGSLISSTVALSQMQRNHTLLQEDYTHLQKLYNQLQDSEKNIHRQLQARNNALQKSESSIAVLTQQYQDRLQITQAECAERLLDAEKKISEAQYRMQERVQLSNEKLIAMEASCENKLKELKVKFEEENARKDKLLKEVEVKLVSEKNSTLQLQTELNILKNKVHLSSDGLWSENKENVHTKQLHFKDVPGLSSTSPRSLTATSPRSQHTRASLPRSPKSPLVPRPSHGLPKSPRSLYMSDPCGLGIGPYYNSSDSEDVRRSSYSPDLGLGSSDNGASSLERVMTMEKSFPAVGATDRASLPTELLQQRSDGMCSVPGHTELVHSNHRLLTEVDMLQKQLSVKHAQLNDALQQLETANARKLNVEKAIYRQLNKTHQVLKKANGNLQQHQTVSGKGATDARK